MTIDEEGYLMEFSLVEVLQIVLDLALTLSQIVFFTVGSVVMIAGYRHFHEKRDRA